MATDPFADYDYRSRYDYRPKKAKFSKRTPSTPAATPEEEKSLLSELGQAGMGVLSTVGNILDTPASVVRGLIKGDPGRALGGILDPSRRVQVEDITGLKSEENDSFGTKAGNFVGNLGVGIATDPLFWLPGGILGATSRAGGALKGAGVIGKGTDWAKLAGQAGGKIGRREAMMTTTAKDAIERMVTKNPALTESAKAAKNTALDTLLAKRGMTRADIEGKKLGALFNAGPMEGLRSWGTLGTGKVAQKIARIEDKIGNAVSLGKYSPLYHLRPLFDQPGTAGIKDADVIRSGAPRRMFEGYAAAESAAKQAGVDVKNILRSARLLEGADPKVALGREAIDVLSKNTEAAGPGREAIATLISSSEPEAVYGATQRLQGLGLTPEQADAVQSLVGDLRSAGHAQSPLRYLGSPTSLNPAGDLEMLGKIAEGMENPQVTDWLRFAEGLPGAAGRLESRHGLAPENVSKLEELLERARSGEAQQQARSLGVGNRELGDSYVKYFPGSTNPEAFPGGSVGRGGKLIERSPEQIARQGYMKNIPGGRAQLDQLFMDPSLQSAQDPKTLAKMMERIYGVEAMGEQGISSKYFSTKDYDKLKKAWDIWNPDDDINSVSLDQLMDFAAQYTDVKPKNRFPKLAKMFLRATPESRKSGLWAEYGAFPVERMIEKPMRRSAQAEFLLDTLSLPGKLGASVTGITPENLVTLGKFLRNAKVSQRPFIERLSERIGRGTTKKDILELKNAAIDPNLAAQLNSWMERTTAGENQKAVANLYDKANTLWKASMTAHPAFVSRNTISAAAQNIFRDMFSGRSYRDASNLLRGKEVDTKRLASNPVFAAEVARRGLDPSSVSSKEARGILQDLAYMHGATGDYGLTFEAPHFRRSAQGYASQLPGGVEGLSEPTTAKGVLRDLLGRSKDTTLNPFAAVMPGFEKSMTGKKGLEWGPFKAAGEATRFTEKTARIAPWLKLTEEGIDPSVAASMVADTHFRYQPSAFTPFERQWMQRIAPFYKFSRQSLPDTLSELSRNPGGKLGQFLRGTEMMRGDNNEITPDYLNSSLAIPIPEGTPLIGPQAGGAPRFLAGMGLVHEDPLGFLGGGPLGMGAELLSRSSPMIKAPLEMVTGKSFFQRGNQGLRDLEEQDPLLGRLYSNVSDKMTGGRTKNPPRIDVLEELAANSPISRVLSSARTLTDPRKSLGSALLNVGTGLRMVDVPEAAQDAQALRLLEGLMKDSGARTFDNVYFPKDQVEKMTPAQQERVGKFMALKKMLERKRKERVKVGIAN